MTQDDIDGLMKFYSVHTERQLIEAMELHIEKLQTKLRKLEPPIYGHRPVREG